MDKIKALIVDDEEAARNVLSSLLTLTDERLEVITPCANVHAAVESIKENDPKIVFLDVEMPNERGYELFKHIDEVNFQTIFVTAYNKFAVKAFEVNAIDYLLKPVDRKRLSEAIDRAIQKIEINKKADDYLQILGKLEDAESKHLVFAEGGKKMVIKQKDIHAIFAQGAYSEIITPHKKYIVTKNLGALEELLAEAPQFFRSHKSWIVNLNYIKKYSLTQKIITLENGIECKLSRFKSADFQQKII